MEYLMEKNKKNYYGPGDPVIIVKKLTEEIIEETLKVYAEEEDGYWLKLYNFADRIETTVFDQLQAKHVAELQELEKLIKADTLAHRKKLDELDNS